MYFQFFYVLTIILVGEMILATAVFVIYTVPEARDNFLRAQPEKILYSAIQRYMDDVEVKAWVDRIQSDVSFLKQAITILRIPNFEFVRMYLIHPKRSN